MRAGVLSALETAAHTRTESAGVQANRAFGIHSQPV